MTKHEPRVSLISIDARALTGPPGSQINLMQMFCFLNFLLKPYLSYKQAFTSCNNLIIFKNELKSQDARLT